MKISEFVNKVRVFISRYSATIFVPIEVIGLLISLIISIAFCATRGYAFACTISIISLGVAISWLSYYEYKKIKEAKEK